MIEVISNASISFGATDPTSSRSGIGMILGRRFTPGCFNTSERSTPTIAERTRSQALGRMSEVTTGRPNWQRISTRPRGLEGMQNRYKSIIILAQTHINTDYMLGCAE